MKRLGTRYSLQLACIELWKSIVSRLCSVLSDEYSLVCVECIA